jgi:hypothetical protein
MIETGASKSFATCSHGAVSPCGNVSTQRGGYNPLIWLNLVCLDAPIVAVSWQWLFGNAFGVSISGPNCTALFLTAWLIYLADRFGDSASLPRNPAMSLRQEFCVRHRKTWLVCISAIAVADSVVVLPSLDFQTVLHGAAVGALALVYLILNRLAPSLWRVLPLKEISIGLLFAVGTVISLTSGLTSAMFPEWLLFAGLCSLNCISIAIWERDLDAAQQHISVATAFPKIRRFLAPGLLLLVLLSLAWAGSATRGSSIHVCIAASAILLLAVNSCRDQVDPDTRTALADLVLLTPVVALAIEFLTH